MCTSLSAPQVHFSAQVQSYWQCIGLVEVVCSLLLAIIQYLNRNQNLLVS